MLDCLFFYVIYQGWYLVGWWDFGCFQVAAFLPSCKHLKFTSSAPPKFNSYSYTCSNEIQTWKEVEGKSEINDGMNLIQPWELSSSISRGLIQPWELSISIFRRLIQPSQLSNSLEKACLLNPTFITPTVFHPHLIFLTLFVFLLEILKTIL